MGGGSGERESVCVRARVYACVCARSVYERVHVSFARVYMHNFGIQADLVPFPQTSRPPPLTRDWSQVRVRRDGTKSYYSDTHTSRSVAAMHDHSDHVRTCGMGELEAVLNGVQFRTRHNDYQLKRPATRSQGYQAMEDIPFPRVPPAVLQRTSVEEQVGLAPGLSP